MKKTWQALDDGLSSDVLSATVLFDGWDSDAKQNALGHLGAVQDVVSDERDALALTGHFVVDLAKLVYAARKKIDGLMDAFCTACEKKWWQVENDSGPGAVAVEFVNVSIQAVVAAGASIATGGAAFPAVDGTLTAHIAGKVTETPDPADVPAQEWSDIADWFIALEKAAAHDIADGFRQVGSAATTISEPDLLTIDEIVKNRRTKE